MRFLADVELVCEECRGTRYKSSVLDVRYKEKNIHDVLQMTVREALAFFAPYPKVTSKLRVLDEVGLGYLRLGQSGTTLSGGEAQRLKLAAHLTRQENTGILYIFDEPTTGLHFDDIQKLLTSFRKLLEGGASVLIIEHNLDVIKSADWMIDMGPEGGDAGGRVVWRGNAGTNGTEFAVAHGEISGSGARQRKWQRASSWRKRRRREVAGGEFADGFSTKFKLNESMNGIFRSLACSRADGVRRAIVERGGSADGWDVAKADHSRSQCGGSEQVARRCADGARRERLRDSEKDYQDFLAKKPDQASVHFRWATPIPRSRNPRKLHRNTGKRSSWTRAWRRLI